MIKKALEKGIDAVNTESEHLPFEPQIFERIIMVDALHHVKDQEKSLQEMWRVLAPGGKIVIEEPDIRLFVVKLLALGEKLLLMRSHFLDPHQIATLCRFNRQAEVSVVADKGMVWITVCKPC
jgi:demethylmenaquinone methyltransferase/2-methoxy-6-polyprenyl-1,4-benzoquinol methylase